ncbi:MAG: DUF3084 domain-containing protein [Synergistaceae bacterium]|nr:DUF3084 domain-containing protein [Synergistaceae bacterium]
MPFSASEFNWQLILIIAAISALVTYVGDVLGMRIGKRRISLLGLRPRYTSTVITTFTGVAVAILTLCAAAYMSASVRRAFFGVNYLEGEIARLLTDQHDREGELGRMEFELAMANIDLGAMERALLTASSDLGEVSVKLSDAQRQAASLQSERERLTIQVTALDKEKTQMEKSVASLRGETEQLKRGLAEMREGRVIAFQGELLAQVSVEGGAKPADIGAALARLARLAEEALAVKNRESGILGAGDAPPKAAITENEKKKIYETLGGAKGRKLLRLTAPANVVQGQLVNGVVDIFDSRLIFQKDEVLMTETIKGGLGQENAADILYTMLKQLNRQAVAKGILPDPISGAVGNLDSLDFYDAVDKISDFSEASSVSLVAAADIYTEGPVDVRIVLGE